MKAISVKDLLNVIDAMRVAEADEFYTGCVSTSNIDSISHFSAATTYQVVRKKLENLPIFEV